MSTDKTITIQLTAYNIGQDIKDEKNREFMFVEYRLAIQKIL